MNWVKGGRFLNASLFKSRREGITNRGEIIEPPADYPLLSWLDAVDSDTPIRNTELTIIIIAVPITFFFPEGLQEVCHVPVFVFT